MNRRYKLELQLVKVPIVWKAKIPEKRIRAKRRIPEYRLAIISRRRETEAFFERVFGSADPDELTRIFTAENLKLEKAEGKIIAFRRFVPLPPIASIRMRISQPRQHHSMIFNTYLNRYRLRRISMS